MATTSRIPKEKLFVTVSGLTVVIEHINALESEVERLKKPKYESGYLRAKFG